VGSVGPGEARCGCLNRNSVNDFGKAARSGRYFPKL
jgi:hypothetical protein